MFFKHQNSLKKYLRVISGKKYISSHLIDESLPLKIPLEDYKKIWNLQIIEDFLERKKTLPLYMFHYFEHQYDIIIA